MKKHTRSILEELNNLRPTHDNDYSIDTTANNIIKSSINLLARIHKIYDDETALDLERRFINSIRTGDPQKFKRGIQKVINNKGL